MTDELRKLRRNYRAGRAPDYLQARIRAAVEDFEPGPGLARPALLGAAVTAVVLVFAAIASLNRTGSPIDPSPTSMSTFTFVSAHIPALQMPARSLLRQPPLPALPAKPRPGSISAPEAVPDNKPDSTEENDHA